MVAASRRGDIAGETPDFHPPLTTNCEQASADKQKCADQRDVRTASGVVDVDEDRGSHYRHLTEASAETLAGIGLRRAGPLVTRKLCLIMTSTRSSSTAS